MKNIPQIREISTLSFNERVLQEAEDARMAAFRALVASGPIIIPRRAPPPPE